MLYPTFPFSRAMYFIANECGYGGCYGSFNDVPEEVIDCLKFLAFEPIMYLLMAYYLNQVVP
jgi:hypothetical protein